MQRLNCTFARDRDDKSYYDSLTDGWGDDGKVLARRNPPANTSNSKNEKSSSRHCQQKNEHDF